VPWTTADLPQLTGRTVLVTGATSGLGEATASALASQGAHVVLATRDVAKTETVMAAIRARAPEASLEHLAVDLADLASVARAAETFLARHDRLDQLVANAGVMATPLRRTVDGFELQLGINHLGHHALVGRLLPALLAAPDARVVLVSSAAHRLGRIDLDDLNWERTRYERWAAYGRSKLANLLFVIELERRFRAARETAIAVGAHPGYADTALQTTGPAMQGGPLGRVTALASRGLNAIAAQPAAQGALPQLYATAAPEVAGGSYWGPDGRGERRGYPAAANRSSDAMDGTLAAALFRASEELTGVRFDTLGGLPA
jgi:NAD(P)-dependent dehydrogenase (short-subunit alcohol dehydrogenase family)